MTTHDATEQAYKNGYEAGKRDAMKWIPVTERLPKRECIAISMLKGQPCYKEQIIGWVFKSPNCKTGYACDAGEAVLCEVTHWMPLPEPPKEDA